MFDPSYAVGFNDPKTNQIIYISKALQMNAEKEIKEIYTFTEYGCSFPSRTKAKKFLREFRINFTEDNYQIMRDGHGYRDLPLTCYEIKVQSGTFDQNAEMCRNMEELQESLKHDAIIGSMKCH